MSDCCDRKQPCTDVCARNWENAYYRAEKAAHEATRDFADLAKRMQELESQYALDVRWLLRMEKALRIIVDDCENGPWEPQDFKHMKETQIHLEATQALIRPVKLNIKNKISEVIPGTSQSDDIPN